MASMDESVTVSPAAMSKSTRRDGGVSPGHTASRGEIVGVMSYSTRPAYDPASSSTAAAAASARAIAAQRTTRACRAARARAFAYGMSENEIIV